MIAWVGSYRLMFSAKSDVCVDVLGRMCVRARVCVRGVLVRM